VNDNQVAQIGGRTLATTQLVFNGEERKFFYREDSNGDKGAIHQVFVRKDYDLQKFGYRAALREFGDAFEQQGKRKLILDLGANIGASAFWFYLNNPGAKIVAVEPEQNNYQLLAKNCEGLEIVALQAAIGSREGTAFLDDPGFGDWGFQVAAQGRHPVKVVTVQNLLDENATGKFAPYICKIDIEGSENELFSENYAWMDLFPLVIIEFHDWLCPGKALSRNFLRAIIEHDFDFVYEGENVFCFNNRLLREKLAK
jgi:FkbM family methyltransferase